jgi:hypothetical protein
LRSAADVKAAERAGDVTVTKTATVVNCPVLGFGQKRIAGFSNGHPHSLLRRRASEGDVRE